MKKQMILVASLIISLLLLTVPMEASANAAKALKSDGSITYILGKDSSDQLIAVNTTTSETIWDVIAVNFTNHMHQSLATLMAQLSRFRNVLPI